MLISLTSFANRVVPTLLADNLNTQLTDTDNAVAPYSYYSSVQAAVNAADEGDTVTVLADSKEDVTVSKPIKIETAGSVEYTGTVAMDMMLLSAKMALSRFTKNLNTPASTATKSSPQSATMARLM